MASPPGDPAPDAQGFLQSALDALTAHIAILDETAAIVAVNAAWRRFAEQNGLGLAGGGLGENYLAVCDRAATAGCPEARGAADGLRALMAGTRDRVDLEYPCHVPDEQRWFVMRATRFAGRGPVRVVVAHEDVTARVLADAAIRRKAELVGELLGELDTDRLARAVTDAATSLTGARFGAFLAAPEDGGEGPYTLRALSGGTPDAMVGDHPPWTTPLFDAAIREGRTVRSDDMNLDLRCAGSVPGSVGPGGVSPLRSHIAVPVVSRGGTVVAGLWFGHEAPGAFAERDERIAVVVSGWAAVALENARLLREAQQARDRAERAAAQTATLQRITAALSQAVTTREVAEAFLGTGLAALDATAGSVCLLTEDEAGLEIVWATGYAPEIVDVWRRMDLWYDIPLTDAIRRSEAIYLESREEWAGRYTHLPITVDETGRTAWAAVPLIASGRCIGAAGINFADPTRTGFADRELTAAVVQQFAQALARARAAEAVERQAALLRSEANTRRVAEAEVRRGREELERLAGRLEDSREQERIRIAREIHDELGGALTALKLDVAWLRKRLPGPDDEAGQRVRAMDGLLAEAIACVRRIATELRPSVLDDLGLPAAVEWMAHEFRQRTGIDCRAAVAESHAAAYGGETATAAFRILQEALTNVARHAEASRVDIRLWSGAGKLRLEVRDDGRGIRGADRAKPMSLGLIGMRERARAAGGTVRVGRLPGAERGTHVLVVLPLAPGAREGRDG